MKDRFPISVALESSDIKKSVIEGSWPSHQYEMSLAACSRRTAKPCGITPNLRMPFYDHEFGKEEFSNLYPFLPAHFDILLHLLGALAKSTGGGLRSAIKVIQDVLIEAADAAGPIADRPVGWLATTVTLRCARKDIALSRQFIKLLINHLSAFQTLRCTKMSPRRCAANTQ